MWAPAWKAPRLAGQFAQVFFNGGIIASHNGAGATV